MNNTITEFSVVKLTRDIPKLNLKKGELGTVVHIYKHSTQTAVGYEVEFIDDEGKTKAVVTVLPSEVTLNQMSPIFRQYKCRLTKENCARLLQALSSTGGNIHSSFSLGKGIPVEKSHISTMFFILKFIRQADLNEFHKLGFQTEETEQIHTN